MIYWGTRRKKWVLRPGRSKQTAVLTVCGSEYLHLYFWMVNPVLKVLIDFLHNLGHLNIIIDECCYNNFLWGELWLMIDTYS